MNSSYRREPRTYRDDWGRGKTHGLIQAAEELEKDPGKVTTNGEIAEWLRARAHPRSNRG